MTRTETIKNYRWQSIAATLFFLPAGIPAILYSCRIKRLQHAAKHDAALKASLRTRTWCWISLGCGIIFHTVFGVLPFLALIASYQGGY